MRSYGISEEQMLQIGNLDMSLKITFLLQLSLQEADELIIPILYEMYFWGHRCSGQLSRDLKFQGIILQTILQS